MAQQGYVYPPATPGYGYPPGQPGMAQPQMQTVVIAQQPMATNHNDGAPQNQRDWSTGICGCCEDCSSCCYAFWCYPCFTCTLANKMDENCCGPICCGFGSVHGCLAVLGVNLAVPSNPNMFLVAMRTKLRTQYGIRGGICKDICCLWCCEFCAVTQMMRELKHHGKA